MDSSKPREPQFRIDLVHGGSPTDQGFTFGAGFLHRQLKQNYYYTEYRLNPLAGAGVTLATTGPLGPYTPPDSGGLALTFVDPNAVAAYIAQHPGSYAVASTNLARSTLNNCFLREAVSAASGGHSAANASRAWLGGAGRCLVAANHLARKAVTGVRPEAAGSCIGPTVQVERSLAP